MRIQDNFYVYSSLTLWPFTLDLVTWKPIGELFSFIQSGVCSPNLVCDQTVIAKILSEHTKSIYNLYIIIILDLWPHDLTIKRGFYSKRITYFFGERFSFIIKLSLLHKVVFCQTSLCAVYDDRNQYFAILWLSVFINKNAYITHLGCVNYI